MIRASLEDIVANNLGTIATVGGSVMVALIAAMGAVWAKRARPGTDVPIKDIWEENRNLVKDANDSRAAQRRAEDRRDDYVAAFDVVWRYLHRIRSAWGVRDHMPELSPADRDVVSRVVEDVAAPD